MWLQCCSLVLLLCALSEAVTEVSPDIRSSVEDFLRSHSHLRVDDSRPLKMSRVPKEKQHRFSKALELAEEALRAVYHELYDAANVSLAENSTEAMKRSLSLSARQSFFSNGLTSASEYLMSLVENSLEDIPSLPRLEAQECMKRSVCEAHNQPKKYGLIGLVLQLLFPPYSTRTEESNNVVSKYQLAARYGRQSNANCGVQYDGCMLNLLDIVQALVNAFIR